MIKKRILLFVIIMISSYAQHVKAWHPDSTWFFNQWEVSHASGLTLNDAGDMKGKYSHIYQFAFSHQYTPEDFGAQMPNAFFPSVGLSLTYADFSQTPVINEIKNERVYKGSYGRFLAVAFTFSRYYHTWGHRNQWRLRGMIENGFAWAFNPYKYPTRMANSVGGRFQVYANVGLDLCYAWGHNEVSIGPEFTHLSNSATYCPNGGVNNVAVALRYRMLAYKDIPKTGAEGYLLDVFQRYLYSVFHVGVGIHAEGDRGGRAAFHGDVCTYTQINLSYAMMFRHTPNLAVGLGLDFFGGCGSVELWKPWLGLALKHETFFRDFAINFDVGVYLNGSHPKGKSATGTRIYEKIGLKYYFPSRGEAVRPYVCYFIKGNEFYAEQFEVAIGFSFDHRYGASFFRHLKKRWTH